MAGDYNRWVGGDYNRWVGGDYNNVGRQDTHSGNKTEVGRQGRSTNRGRYSNFADRNPQLF